MNTYRYKIEQSYSLQRIHLNTRVNNCRMFRVHSDTCKTLGICHCTKFEQEYLQFILAQFILELHVIVSPAPNYHQIWLGIVFRMQ